MNAELLTDLFEDENPLSGKELLELRVLAGFSRSELERCSELSAGRVRAVENGYLRLHRVESAKLRHLLVAEMTHRARAIAEHLGPHSPPSVDTVRTCERCRSLGDHVGRSGSSGGQESGSGRY